MILAVESGKTEIVKRPVSHGFPLGFEQNESLKNLVLTRVE